MSFDQSTNRILGKPAELEFGRALQSDRRYRYYGINKEIKQ